MTSASRNVGTTLLFENDRLRVWDLTLEPDQSCELHQHVYDYVFVNVTSAEVELHEPGQAPLARSLDEGFVQYMVVGQQGQRPHQLRNAGTSTLRQILIEFVGESASAEALEPETNGRFLYGYARHISTAT